MADHSKIEWTDATWNIATGCGIVSPGCTNCYAMRLAGTRLKNHPSRAGLTKPSRSGPVWTGEVRFNEQWLDQPLRWRKPRMIFVAAHGDLFHPGVPDEVLDKVFAVMALCPQHTFQVLTKRPERMREYLSDPQTPFRIARDMDEVESDRNIGPEDVKQIDGYPGYFASSHGLIYSEKRGKRRRLKPDVGEQGHERVQLYREGKTGQRGDRVLVHRIILETFIGPPPSPNAQGRHRDGNPRHNAISNLSWGNQGENWSDSKRHGNHRRYSKLSHDQAAEIRRRHSLGETGEALAREFDVSATQIRNIASGSQWSTGSPISWPLASVWLGVSVEDQQRANERIPHLLATPAAKRFVSAEPLLGPVGLDAWMHDSDCERFGDGCSCRDSGGPYEVGLDWVIVGGESQTGARHMQDAWAYSLLNQCRSAGVKFLMKQMGGHPRQRPIPDDLMVREWPE